MLGRSRSSLVTDSPTLFAFNVDWRSVAVPYIDCGGEAIYACASPEADFFSGPTAAGDGLTWHIDKVTSTGLPSVESAPLTWTPLEFMRRHELRAAERAAERAAGRAAVSGRR